MSIILPIAHFRDSLHCPRRGSCKAIIGRVLLVNTETYIMVPALHCLAGLDAPSHLWSLC